jgi:hypothetical protein
MKTTQTLRLTFALFLLTICGACESKDHPLVEFQPATDSLIKLSFSYPKTWNWEMTPGSSKLSETLYALNPYPAEDLKKTGRLIAIHVSLNSPQERMQESIELLLRNALTLSTDGILNDKLIQIGDHDIRWFTYKQAPDISQGETQPYIREKIYLLAGDRYYIISLSILEEEQDGQFHNEFKSMIESIKILP